jgi:catechol 2,3-dioxygenase
MKLGSAGEDVPIPIRPLGIGEVVVRVADLRRAIAFYRDILRFQLIRVLHDAIAFMRVAHGVAGHTQIIGLFGKDRRSSRSGQTWDGAKSRLSTLHHFAIEISRDDYDNVLEYLRRQGLEPNIANHSWVGWKSIYVSER